MNLVVFGASGTIGRRIVAEALERGHAVTAVTRNPARLEIEHERLRNIAGDVSDPASVAAVAAGHDAAISAYGPRFPDDDPATLSVVAGALIDGLERAGVRRLLVVGGAGSLEVAPGLQLIDSPGFHDDWKPIAGAHRDALEIFKAADLDWTVLSPAALIYPGERTGSFRLGGDALLSDEQGQSRISTEDYAVALIDEVDNPRHVRRRFTVGY